MISYPFVEELFRNILKQSAAIGGRLLVCHRMGREINSDDLVQVITDTFGSQHAGTKRYPIVLLMPLVSTGSVLSARQDWERNQVIMFFLKQSFAGGVNQIASPNSNTRTSTHRIVDDWHDMKRCALDFLEVLNNVARKKNLVASKLRSNNSYDYRVTPVSEIGVDKLSGVRLDFFIDLNMGCPLEDYSASAANDVVIPADDPHPPHQL